MKKFTQLEVEEKSGWKFCQPNEHEYSAYKSDLFGIEVCFTCDPAGENNRHRPSAMKAIRAFCGHKTADKFALENGHA